MVEFLISAPTHARAKHIALDRSLGRQEWRFVPHHEPARTEVLRGKRVPNQDFLIGTFEAYEVYELTLPGINA